MSGICYVDGQYVAHGDAHVHMEDRGYQFSDGVYEVIAVYGGKLVDAGPHLDRLDRSMAELGITPPGSRSALEIILRETMRRNRLIHGSLYLQVTRGVARREHAYSDGMRSVLTVAPRRATPPVRSASLNGHRVIAIPDIRWQRCDIKTVALLPNIMGKKQAALAGAAEAWMTDAEGMVTEGTSSNAWIVTQAGELITRQLDHGILPGITRRAIIAYARERQIKVVERAFSLDEAKQAREAFYTSATAILRPVVQIDDAKIGDGKVGPIAKALADVYFDALDNV